MNRELIPVTADSCRDLTARPGVNYEYILGIVKTDGVEVQSKAVTVKLPPAALALYQNHPNHVQPGDHHPVFPAGGRQITRKTVLIR